MSKPSGIPEIPILEQSLEVAQRLQEIRSVRSTPDGEIESSEIKTARRQEARQQIAQLREDLEKNQFQEKAKKLQLRYIHLQNKFLAFMDKNPNADWTVIQQQFRKEKLSATELEIMSSMFHQLKERRYQSLAVIDKFRRQAKAELVTEKVTSNPGAVGQRAARLLFEAITGSPPKGNVTLIQTNFAVGLATEEADYHSMRPEDWQVRVRGHYQDAQTLRNEKENQALEEIPSLIRDQDFRFSHNNLI